MGSDCVQDAGGLSATDVAPVTVVGASLDAAFSVHSAHKSRLER